MGSILGLFLVRFFIILAIVALLLYVFNTFMRKLLKVEKRKLFSYNHVNDKHKLVDWIIRISFIIILLAGYIINNVREPLERLWFLETYFILIIFVFSSEIVRAVMEWKYASNRNDYIFTISQLAFIALILIILFSALPYLT